MGKGGGGGNTVTQTTGIDPEFKPYLVDVLSDVTNRYKRDTAAGPDAIVAALDPAQKEALNYQQNLARQAITGQGLYDTTGAQRRDLQNLMGTSLGQASAGGSLGSARSQAAMNQALADRSLQHLQRRQQETAAGIESLGQTGSTMQQYAQQRLDAPHTSAERYFGYLGSAPQTTEKTGGGGGGK